MYTPHSPSSVYDLIDVHVSESLFTLSLLVLIGLNFCFGWDKLNCDGSLNFFKGCGISFILQEDTGDVFFAGCKFLEWHSILYSATIEIRDVHSGNTYGHFRTSLLLSRIFSSFCI